MSSKLQDLMLSMSNHSRNIRAVLANLELKTAEAIQDLSPLEKLRVYESLSQSYDKSLGNMLKLKRRQDGLMHPSRS